MPFKAECVYIYMHYAYIYIHIYVYNYIYTYPIKRVITTGDHAQYISVAKCIPLLWSFLEA